MWKYDKQLPSNMRKKNRQKKDRLDGDEIKAEFGSVSDRAF